MKTNVPTLDKKNKVKDNCIYNRIEKLREENWKILGVQKNRKEFYRKKETLKILSKPFVKWVGGKRSAIEHLKKRIPENYEKYFELFVGGGALFFEIQPKKSSYLNDVNSKLILVYKALKTYVHSVIEELRKHEKNYQTKSHKEDYFYEQRDLFNKEQDKIKIAGLFIFLNKTCYNGLYRVNKQGRFNVPFGKYKAPKILDEENLLNVSKALKNTQLTSLCFNKCKVEANSFYYLDPPYHTTFDQYDKNKFNLEDHKNLRDFCKQIDQVGSKFMLSNSDNKEIRKLYKEFKIHSIEVGKSVSCKSNGRGKEKELIVTNY